MGKGIELVANVGEVMPDEATDRIVRFTDTIHYVLPKLLLSRRRWTRSEPVRTMRRAANVPDGDLPLGAAAGTEQVELVDPETADPRLRGLFDDIRATHGHPGVAGYDLQHAEP